MMKPDSKMADASSKSAPLGLTHIGYSKKEECWLHAYGEYHPEYGGEDKRPYARRSS